MSYAAVQVPGRRGGALVTRIARIIEQTERGMVRVALLEDVPPLAGEDVFPVSGVPRMEESGETQEVHLHRISHNVLVVSTLQVANNSVLVFPGIQRLYRSTQPVVDVITAGSDADKVTASRLVQLWHVFQALQKAMHDLGNHVGPGEVRTDKFAVTEDFAAYFIGHLQRGEQHESQVRVRQSESNQSVHTSMFVYFLAWAAFPSSFRLRFLFESFSLWSTCACSLTSNPRYTASRSFAGSSSSL